MTDRNHSCNLVLSAWAGNFLKVHVSFPKWMESWKQSSLQGFLMARLMVNFDVFVHQRERCFVSCTNPTPNHNGLAIFSSFDNECEITVSFDEMRLLYPLWPTSTAKNFKNHAATDQRPTLFIKSCPFLAIVSFCHCFILKYWHPRNSHTLFNLLPIDVHLVCGCFLRNVGNISSALYAHFSFSVRCLARFGLFLLWWSC